MEIVIIGQNEGKYVDKMITSLPTDIHIIYVADRCTDNTKSLLSKYSNVDIIDTTPLYLHGRQTSFCRNLGLRMCRETSDVLFLDGDRYITHGNVYDLENTKFDSVFIPLDDDLRKKEYFDYWYGRVMEPTFSCGMFLRRDAIKKILDFQGFLFDESLQYYWGIEDTTLGDVMYGLGITACLSDEIKLHGSFLKHRLDSFEALEKRLRKRIDLENVLKFKN